MTLCEDIVRELLSFAESSVFCGPNEAGYEVLNTPFVYPDRDNIQVFIKELPGSRVLLSDLAQTMSKLSEYGFTPANAPRRRAMINQIISSMNVNYDRGIVSVVIEVNNGSRVGSRFWDLAIALQRLSDLAFTVPAYARATFSDEFENFIIERNIPYRRGGKITLETGYSFTPDFVIAERKIIQLLSGSSSGYARERLDRVYVNFSELGYGNDNRERLAVADDTQAVWQDSELVGPLTHVGGRVLLWSQKRELVRVLEAA
jgi:hypothetical protein